VTKKKVSDKVLTGSGIKTSAGAVLLSCTLYCRVCGSSEFFEWHDQEICPEDVQGIDTLGLIIAVAHSQNWIAQRVHNIHEGENCLFVLCPTCLALFFSATTEPGASSKETS
jgi:hypothetical protein